MISSAFRERRRDKGGPLLTLTLNTFDPVFVEIAAQIGIDIVWIEMEHASISLREAENLCRMIQGSGLLSLIRLPNCQRDIVLKAAEIGSDMLMAPMIERRSDLEDLVKYSKYAPLGERGFYSSSRALNYGLGSTIAELRAAANDRLMLWGQIETLPALEQLEEFCQVPGIDGIFMGSGDLSSAYGVPGDILDTRVLEAVRYGTTTARQCGKICASVLPPAEIPRWKSSELDMLVIGGNVGFYVAAAKSLQEKLNLPSTEPALASNGRPLAIPKPHALSLDSAAMNSYSPTSAEHENQ